MEIFDVPRGCGKTTHLIIESVKNGYPIVVGLGTQKKYLQERAEQITDRQVEVYTVKEILAMENKPKKVLVDDLPYVLNTLLGCKVEEAAMTSKSREMYDIQRYENLSWISMKEQAPPIEREVNIKYTKNNKEIINVDKLISMMNNTYIWAYGDYTDCENMCWKLLD